MAVRFCIIASVITMIITKVVAYTTAGNTLWAGCGSDALVPPIALVAHRNLVTSADEPVPLFAKAAKASAFLHH